MPSNKSFQPTRPLVTRLAGARPVPIVLAAEANVIQAGSVKMKRSTFYVVIALIAGVAWSYASPPTTAEKLREWRTGVWLSKGNGYSIWTDTHYFVVSAAGSSEKPNVYCGSSRVQYTDKGIARHQNLRIRQTPNGAMRIHGDYSMYSDGESGNVEEAPLEIDIDLFKPGVCNIVEGVIYDSVLEETPEYILLASCNGDRVKLFNDGRSLYRSSDGYETWSYRIEPW